MSAGPTFPGLSKLPSRGALRSKKSFWYCGAALQGEWGAGGDSIRKKGCWGLLLSRKWRERFVWVIQTFQSLNRRDNQGEATIPLIFFEDICRVVLLLLWGFKLKYFKNKEFFQSQRFSSSRDSVAERTTRHSCGLFPSRRAGESEKAQHS